MSETFTLERLFEAFPGGIRVPRIQRGYVQGRDDEKGKEIRANFRKGSKPEGKVLNAVIVARQLYNGTYHKAPAVETEQA